MEQRQPESVHIIGVTGGICSGKDVVCSILAEKGYYIIDVDALGHQALQVKKSELLEAFGSGILDAQNRISRPLLADIVFEDAAQLALLESIVHPWMITEARRLASVNRPAVLNAALLYAMGLQELCDMVLLVEAPLLKRLYWLHKRNRMGFVKAWRRIRAQRRLSTQYSLADTDIYRIRNNASVDRLRKQVLEILS